MMRLFFLFTYFFTQFTFALSLSPIENKIRNDVSQQINAQTAFLEKLVNINSGTTHLKGVYQVGELMKSQFDQLGFKTYWVYGPPEMHRAATLIAERKGSKGKRILLIGHLDTVFSPQDSFQRFKLGKHWAKGPGVVDDKGGIVILLYALKALHAAQALDNTTITVVLTGDEEDSGKPTSISRKPLVEAAKQSDVALDFESAISLDTASIARRGAGGWVLKVQGNEGHSGDIFRNKTGDGAIFELSRILNTMHTEFSKEKYLTFNPGLVLGGTTVKYDEKSADGYAFGKSNVIPKIAVAKGDYRFLTVQQKQSFEMRLSKIVQNNLPGTKATIVFINGMSPMPPTQNNSLLLKKYSEVSTDLGLGPVVPLDPAKRGAGDISYVASIVPANLVGLGAHGVFEHSQQEAIELRSLPIQTKRAAILIYRLTHEE